LSLHEHRVRCANLHADACSKGEVCRVEVVWAPAEQESVQGHNERGEVKPATLARCRAESVTSSLPGLSARIKVRGKGRGENIIVGMRDGGRIGFRCVPIKPEQQCPSPFALPTASIERKLAVDMTNGTPRLALAPAGESSPSLCRISALYCWQSKATAYIIMMGSIAWHTGYDAPQLQRLEVVAICAASASVAKRIHVGN
jgi:hypothetical protein